MPSLQSIESVPAVRASNANGVESSATITRIACVRRIDGRLPRHPS